MRLDLGWPPAPHLPSSSCVAPAIRHKNTSLKSVRIVRKDTASKPCSHYRWWRCYKLVSVLMSVDLGWPVAPHLTSSSCVASAKRHLECKNGPLTSARIVRKDTASKPCSHYRWGRCYKLVSVLMSVDLGWPKAPHITSYNRVWLLQYSI